ncbi:hypothetical protein PC111_g25336 [Phytophthora cactorum]|nr:hypothetical protein PC111_g25336 [Phytophthora cactorum]
MHLMTATRPDIAYAVGYVSRFMENPQEEHWVAVKRIFRYLQGTKTHGICFKPGNKIDFRGYSDADWAGDLADRKSTSGYTFMLMSAPVSWGCWQDDASTSCGIPVDTGMTITQWDRNHSCDYGTLITGR